MEEALQQRRRAQIAQRFLSGEWGVELETYEAVQARERLRAQQPGGTEAVHRSLLLEAQFDTLPVLATPTDLWQRAIELGQACRRIGRTVLSLDLLVAAVALRLHRLTRPV